MRIAFSNLAEGKGSNNPMLTAIWMARKINQVLGGPFVGPWEIEELPGDWLDAIIGMETTVPRLAAGKAQVESAIERWRNSLPQYRQ